MICHGELPHAIMCGGGLKHRSENERNAALDFYYVCAHLDTNEKLIFVCALTSKAWIVPNIW